MNESINQSILLLFQKHYSQSAEYDVYSNVHKHYFKSAIMSIVVEQLKP